MELCNERLIARALDHRDVLEVYPVRNAYVHACTVDMRIESNTCRLVLRSIAKYTYQYLHNCKTEVWGKRFEYHLLFMKAEHIEYTADGGISIIQETILRRVELIFEPLSM